MNFVGYDYQKERAGHLSALSEDDEVMEDDTDRLDNDTASGDID